MSNLSVVYPRSLIRTSQACSVVMLIEFVLMMLVIATAAAAEVRSIAGLALPFACAIMSLGLGKRALGQLQRLERDHQEPDELMVNLFDTALGVPTLGLLAVVAALLPV